MPIKQIITQQPVEPVKAERARQLRQAMTPAERILWHRLRGGRLEGYHFRRQQVIDRFIVDFYCHAAALVVEVDGGVHLEQIEYDQAREEYLKARGLRVLRFTNLEVTHQLDTVLGAILEACRANEI